jgi:hypothetical protein
MYNAHMHNHRRRLVCVFVLFLCLGGARHASAQAFTGDARNVAMGGGGGNANIAFSMVEPAQRYRVIPLPIGLIQVLSDIDVFNPTSDKFDPAAAIERASNPLHYTFGRKSSSGDDPQGRFIRDVVNGELNRDLATYSGFTLPEHTTAEGLASGSFGHTFKFARQPGGAFHGIYVGAGPYLSYSTEVDVDPRLTDIFETGAHYTNSTLQVQNGSGIQLAMSIVVGYRGRLPFPGGETDEGSRDGIYLAANYRHLKGFQYYEPAVDVRFDTDNQGLISLNPATTPIVVDDLEASSGSGRAVDIGIQFVRDRFEAGIGVNGIGNQIDWTELTLKRYTLNSLIAGGEFVEDIVGTPLTSLVVKLPVVTSGNFGFDALGFAVTATATHGFNGNSFHGGAERRFGSFAVRGGGRYSRGKWDPTYGFGVGRRVALDVGFYGTHSNLQNKRQTSMAVSIRIESDE